MKLSIGAKHRLETVTMSLSLEQQVEIFKTLLGQSQYNLGDAMEDVVNAFVETIKQSNLETEPIVTKKKKDVDVVKKPKRKSGYNIFLSEKMGKEKMEMGDAVQAWKQLTEEEKGVWNQKAKELKPFAQVEQKTSVETKKRIDVVKKPRKKSGYSIFMSSRMKDDRMKMDEAVWLWKQLTEEDRLFWNGLVDKL